jgi:hypothetical protein
MDIFLLNKKDIDFKTILHIFFCNMHIAPHNIHIALVSILQPAYENHYAMTFEGVLGFEEGAESMILPVPPAESMILSAGLSSPLSPLLLSPSMLLLPLLSSLQSSLLLPTSNPLPLPLLPLPSPSLLHFPLLLLVDCCLAPPCESMILSVHVESSILSAGGAEGIILSAGGAESMMLSACAESMILSVPPWMLVALLKRL